MWIAGGMTDGRRGMNALAPRVQRGAGRDFVPVAVDDAMRLACVEVLPDGRKDTTTGFLPRAARVPSPGHQR